MGWRFVERCCDGFKYSPCRCVTQIKPAFTEEEEFAFIQNSQVLVLYIPLLASFLPRGYRVDGAGRLGGDGGNRDERRGEHGNDASGGVPASVHSPVGY